ncbi:MAG: SGNH/GDSL hydrolase family protein [Polyangiaceae bacterium]
MKRTTSILVATLAAACGPPSEPASPTGPTASVSASAAPSASAEPAASTTSSAEPMASASAEVSSTATQDAPPLPPPQPPPIPPNTAVLHIGDSFLLAGFAQALKPRMKELGVRYEVKSEQSSFTVTWAPKMELTVANTQPDLVIINLGANEMSNTDPPAHAPAVRRIVKSIGDRPCVWVSPPSWRKDTGILDVIRENSAPCRFFDSDEHVKEPIPRQSDKIHPNAEGGAIWAAAFWKWLQEQRAPAEPVVEGAKKPSPWKLKPAPPEEHQAKNKPKE